MYKILLSQPMYLVAPVSILGIDLAFILFAITLAGVALLHHRTLEVSLAGLGAVLAYKLLCTDFNLPHHLLHEGKEMLNLFALLLGFAVLADHFEHSGVPAKLPHYLPDDWKGGFVLLALTFVLSAFLDNIAATMIAGGIAHVVFKKKLHVGYLAAIVAAANAGGSGSVLGDTTTTMMWIDGVPAGSVINAYVAAVPALLISGVVASLQQHRYHPIMKEEIYSAKISVRRLVVSFMILSGAVATNVAFDFPALGVWLAIFMGSFVITTHWRVVRRALPGSLFLLALVMSASMMPVEQLPPASWHNTLGLGFLSSVFDNIPLTKLALKQGGYDWGMLAFTVGYGGSMMWFGSSAGVALSNMYAEIKSVPAWLRHGWHVWLAYVLSSFIFLLVCGWNPQPPHR
ncbi:MAG: hypothetical protein NZM35_06030 [Chitinophagales bacterium]|nr:hypothetical protein [Chitinophagales bacterium]MDW8417985.1 hypothetical protein [Chitinophagales bacterium]